MTEIKTPKLTEQERKFFAEFSPSELNDFFEESALMFADYSNHDSNSMAQLANDMIAFSKKFSKKLSKLSKLSQNEIEEKANNA